MTQFAVCFLVGAVLGWIAGKIESTRARLEDVRIIESYYLPTSLNEPRDGRAGQCCVPIGVVEQLKRRISRDSA